ncbi:LysR family transcriptional regulator [Azoarcus sp. KH32C]|uniref:LysR family transcriptional regulator n=1 Tax=Azoarcus sp. KH32C TaxID=748247 RepID=UPI0002385D22|nr:LysR family transcriptional regulator [Azoarcus sp. KH32C]BAL26982.1 transcriptional regulator, LysR family [Azoarcus sp. KH32C]
MQQYDLPTLKSFITVADAGGFSRAAEQMGTSTAAISRRVAALEQALGIQLFRRTTRRIDLTEAGHQFYADVVNVFHMLEEAEERVRVGRERVSGLIRVAAPLSFGIQRLAPLLPAFMQRHPDLKIQLLLEDRYTDLVAEGIDVALRIGTLADSTLIARRIAPVARVFCASPAYLEAHGVPESPQDLSRHCCLEYSQRGSREDWGAVFGVPADRLQIHGNLVANNAEVLKECAIQGMGITLLPDFVVQDALADGRLRQVLAHCHPEPFGLHAVRPSSRMVPARVRLFIDYMSEALGGVAAASA